MTHKKAESGNNTIAVISFQYISFISTVIFVLIYFESDYERLLSYSELMTFKRI